jgi:hypothetical protein
MYENELLITLIYKKPINQCEYKCKLDCTVLLGSNEMSDKLI